MNLFEKFSRPAYTCTILFVPEAAAMKEPGKPHPLIAQGSDQPGNAV